VCVGRRRAACHRARPCHFRMRCTPAPRASFMLAGRPDASDALASFRNAGAGEPFVAALLARPVPRAHRSCICDSRRKDDRYGIRLGFNRKAWYALPVQDEIVLRFLDEDVAVRATLLREHAPETCAAVLDALPVSGLARHGIYSGSEVYLVLPELITPPREHATTIVGAGDVGFLTVGKGSGYRIDEAYSEVCWFYDLDAIPSMPEGPIAVNIFARLHDADDFFSLCRRMRLEGAKRLEIVAA
jgi:Protein of unknown function (DUF3830)